MHTCLGGRTVKAHGRGELTLRRRLVVSTAREGFSLIEVTIAMGVVAFTLVALLGLLSTGLKVARQAKGELIAAQVASSLLNERRSAPLAQLDNNPLPQLTNSTASLQQALLDRSGLKTASTADAYYSVFYDVKLDTNSAGTSTNGARIYLALTHPAQTGSGYTNIAKASERYETTTYIRLP